MADNLETAFWVALAFFGAVSLASGVSAVVAGTATLAVWAQFAGGALVLAAAGTALVRDEGVGADATGSGVRALVVAGALALVGSLVLAGTP